MTPEQQKYFDDMEFMFGQQGWKNFVEDIQIRQTQEKENALTSKQPYSDLQLSLGRNEVFNYILGLESVLSEVKRQLQEIDNEQVDSI